MWYESPVFYGVQILCSVGVILSVRAKSWRRRLTLGEQRIYWCCWSLVALSLSELANLRQVSPLVKAGLFIVMTPCLARALWLMSAEYVMARHRKK